MEGWKFDEAGGGGGGGSTCRTSPPPHAPNYTYSQVQAALAHLASIDPIELCSEAKVERCRATRDLRSCGRCVQSVLISCGHAALCEECSQRCDICPICRNPLPKDGNRLRLRLYYECIEASLISKRCDDRLQDKDYKEDQSIADVQRLYSLFDVSLENNLVSLICHYVTDVCMDETAVSSDPVIAFLLDEKVVKDWCKRAFKNILTQLQAIYNLTSLEMKESLNLLLKISVKLAGISMVLEVLESSFRGSVSAKLHDLHHLQESILKTKQHMEIVIWCIRHQFLENVRSRHSNFASWCSLVQDRKSAASKRSWPDSMNWKTEESSRQSSSTLFIEEALSNLDADGGNIDNVVEELSIASLQREEGSLLSRSKLLGKGGCYPFENLRAAADLLFLQGNSDLVVAKQAIFLYYLFDRQWTMPDEKWRFIVDDFAATFSITRHSLLESFTFYLLDDHTDEALQEASRLLPEIAGPTIHPKVAQALLERQQPDAALMVLRWSGQDGGASLVSLGEAVTAVRVRVECGLLTEAFLYQRMVCTKVKDKKLRDASDKVKDDCWNWVLWVEALVTEICCLCIRRNLVDRMIELPWNPDEEKHLHKCLLDFAMGNPSKAVGGLLVVFYLQRHRYIEAYRVDCTLQKAEEDFISKNSLSEEDSFKIRSKSHWRRELVARGIELLPDVLQQQVKAGKIPEVDVSSRNETDIPPKSYLPQVQGPILGSLLVPSSIDSSLAGITDIASPPLKPPVLPTPSKIGGPLNISSFGFGNFSSSTASTIFFNKADKELNPGSVLGVLPKSDEISIFANLPTASSLKEFNRSSSSVPRNSIFQNNQRNKISPERAQNGSIDQLQISSSFFTRVAANPTQLIDLGYLPVNNLASPWSHEPKDFSTEDINPNGGPRWRSDDVSDDEDHHSPDKLARMTPYTTSTRRIRKGRGIRP
ncbi:E3 ubiquitin-protein ligase HOS1 [Abeliophyllum distichum]|uniref:E3 ubiquitin-protein ligase HOS1 n=1 Tax=Abeliophyllum distichum TaxID=126358 RepID=A0ABD1UJP5_9LAMI